MTTQQTTASPTRHRILVAASRLFSDQGFAGTSTRQIAEAVGITQPGLYRHFASKSDVLLALSQEILSPGVTIAKKLQEAPGSPAARLARLVRGLSLVLAESPYRAAFLVTEPALTESGLSEARRLYRHWTRAIEVILREGIDAGEFREVDPRIAQVAIMSLTDLLMFPAPGSTRDKVQHIVEFAIRGVLADASQASELAARDPGTPKKGT